MSNIKKCRNTECGKGIIGIRNDCNDTCKQRYFYLKHLKENQLDIKWEKKYKNNRKILNDLYNRGKKIVNLELLEAIGFDFNYLKEREYRIDSVPWYVINDFNLIIESNTHILIEKIK